MTVIAAKAYRDGKPAGMLAITDPAPVTTAADFVWIGLFEPSAQELSAVQRHYGLHPLAVEAALNAHQLPKVEIFGDQLFIVARTAHLEGDAIRYGETAIFVGPRHIITVRHGSARGHGALRAQLEAAPTLLAHGVDYVLHAVLDFIVEGYMPIVDTIEEEVLRIEQRTIDHFLGRDDVTRIFTLRRELIRFRRILSPMTEVASRLAHLESPFLDKAARPYFRDLHNHARRVETMVDHLREVLTSVFEVSHLLESQRQGDITRRLAAWAAILAVPTAIAGIYGMNFDNMPELHWREGYFIVMGVIAALCGLLYVRFKHAGWL